MDHATLTALRVGAARRPVGSLRLASSLLAALLVPAAAMSQDAKPDRAPAAPAQAPKTAPKSGPAPGYRDTPQLPGSRWRVHDADRPRPAVVRPGPGPSTPVPPPSDAVVLFGGEDLSAWTGAGQGGEACWKLDAGAMVVNRTGDIQTKQSFADC